MEKEHSNQEEKENKQTEKTNSEIKITKDMIIEDVLNILGRDSALIMMEHGLHCISCHIATVETLEQGMYAHGYTEEDLELLLKDLNRLLEQKKEAKTN